MISKQDVTIIIPTLYQSRNRFALRECFLSLIESGFPSENIVIAYNNCVVDSEPYLIDISKEFESKFINLSEQGQCKAVNAAAATVDTEWIMVSNDDMVYPPDWFERLTKFDALDGEYNLQFDCISPQLIEPIDGAPTFIKYFCGGVGGDWDKEKFMKYAKTHEGTGVRSGFNIPFLIKKEVWDLVGGYDVNYDPWGSNSDSDLEYKFKLAGIDMCQNTNCPVYHFSQTSGTFEPRNRDYWEKNFAYFEQKWGFPRTDEGIWEATFEIPYDKLKYRPKWAKIPGEEPA